MSKVVLDWDVKYRKGRVISDSLDIIRHNFSTPNPNVRIMRHKYGQSARVAQRLYAITEGGRFDIGLLIDILKYLRTAQYEFDIIVTPLLESRLISAPIILDEMPVLSMAPRDFQVSGVERGLSTGRGVFVVGTGGGKTYLMALLDRAFKMHTSTSITLIALPAQLVRQTTSDLLEYGIHPDDISVWSEGSALDIKPVIVASYKTIQAQTTSFKRMSKRPKGKEETQEDYDRYVQDFDDSEVTRLKSWKARQKSVVSLLKTVSVAIFDEVHTLRADNKINKIFDMLDTDHIFGLTGTMPSSIIDRWNIVGKIGPVLEEISASELESRGYVAKAVARIIHINHTNPIQVFANPSNPTAAYNTECEWLYTNSFRNSVISKICSKLPNNTLIVVDKLLHGDTLFDRLTKALPDKKVYWIRGETTADLREDVRQEMERESNIVCIAMSKVFSTGTNIKNIHYVMFAQGGKAKITIIQSIGRGRRLHNNKQELVVLDIADNTKYSTDHLAERLLRYQEERISYEIKQFYETNNN